VLKLVSVIYLVRLLSLLAPAEYAATTRAKRKGTKAGKQHVAQPKKIAKKTRAYRKVK